MVVRSVSHAHGRLPSVKLWRVILRLPVRTERGCVEDQPQQLSQSKASDSFTVWANEAAPSRMGRVLQDIYSRIPIAAPRNARGNPQRARRTMMGRIHRV